MENKEKVLEVKNLRISFKTNTGTVKAVRGIDFNLYKGRTLAIVGESGSGKSVTSKAILGILANNKIVEDGQIIFDGKDLLRIDEEKFTQIRGVKISMIFQDPLSSLNPIMKVGKQLTEAMYLKAKASKRDSKHFLKRYNAALKKVDPTTFNDLVDTIEQMTINSTIDNIQKYSQLFISTLEVTINEFISEIKFLSSVVEDYKNNYFVTQESFDLDKAKKDLEKIENIVKKAKFALAFEPDDIIDVFPVTMKEYFRSYSDSIRRLEARKDLLNKNNSQTIYDLPAQIRAKEREVIIEPEKYISFLKETIEKLLNHLNQLQTSSSLTPESLVDVVMKHYFDNIILSKSSMTQDEAKKRAIQLLKEVGINDPERRYNQYPFEFSGGMRQRIVIAIALSSNPEVLICDEPTTALDVTIQAQILELINKLKAEKNLSIIFITHDLGVVANMADDIAVMYAGKIVEYGTVYDIFYDPRHPYTWALLGSMPDLETKEKLDAIPGTPPNMLLPPKGDAFAPRNKYALEIDFEEQPNFYQISPTHAAASWLCDENAPDVEAPTIVRDRIFASLKNNPNNKPEYENKKNSILNSFGGNK